MLYGHLRLISAQSSFTYIIFLVRENENFSQKQNSFSLLCVLGSFASDLLFVNYCFLNVTAKRLNNIL